MSYSTLSDVRNNIGLDSAVPSDAIITGYITKADRELDAICAGNALRYQETIRKELGMRLFDLTNDFKEVKEIRINRELIREYDQENLLENGNIEDGSSTAPDYWTSTAGTGDTLTWASDYSFSLNRSLKITKAAAVNSYWESDSDTVDQDREYMAEARIKVDSNTSGKATLKIVFKDSSGAAQQTFTSKTVTQEITQPTSASTVKVVSTDADDTLQVVTIEGTSNGLNVSEAITLTGTTAVTSTNTFSYIRGVRKSDETEGTVTVKSNSDVVTNASLSAKELSKEDWIKVQIVGSTVEDNQTVTVQFYVSSSAASGEAWADEIRLLKRNWRPNYSARNIEIFDSIPNNALIQFTYLRSRVSKIVNELSKDLASMYVIALNFGIETTGMNYTDLRYKFYGGSLKSPMVSFLMGKIEENLKELQSYDHSSPDFIVSETDR